MKTTPILSYPEKRLGAVLSMVDALNAKAYAITLLDRSRANGRDRSCNFIHNNSKLFKRQDFDYDMLKALASQNLRNFDVFITPLDEHKFYILVDDMDAAGVERFKSSGFAPSVVIETSKNNYQMVVRVQKDFAVTGLVYKAHAVFKHLNATYGATGMQGGVVHAFRVPMYYNKKPGRNDYGVRLAECTAGLFCAKTADLIINAPEEQLSESPMFDEAKKTALASIDIDSDLLANSLLGKAFMAELKSQNKRVIDRFDHDQSDIDFEVCRRLLWIGYSDGEVATAMRYLSPTVVRKSKADDYCRLTVFNARARVDRQRAQQQQS